MSPYCKETLLYDPYFNVNMKLIISKRDARYLILDARYSMMPPRNQALHIQYRVSCIEHL